ncbi:acetyltransferase (isoleucine patch superfamily) [Burkholderia sp. Ch1-1]|nr:acetyltransferase (isoleucine patch superfamily) [Burkholderia sp. Ch1-1]
MNEQSLARGAASSLPADQFNPGYLSEGDLASAGFGSIGRNVLIARNCIIIGLQNIHIGSDVRIDGPTVLAASSGHIRIGSHVHVGGFGFLAGVGGIDLEDFSGLSQGVRIYSASDDYSGDALTNPTVPREFLNVEIAPVRLGRHVIIGSGSVILPGCNVGEGSSVGAMSLVTKSLAPWAIYAGAPARFLKKRSQQLLAMEAQLIQQRK